MSLEVALVSPERILYTGEADMVVCRTPEGEIAFLTGHAPFVGTLEIAPVRVILTDGAEVKAAVHGGFVEVRDNKVSVLSDVAELPDQIDTARAQRALEAAERDGAESEEGDVERAIRRAKLRIAVAETK
ncbi:MAG: F-type H+-transporting ATPase subunit epsilon [Acidimicrobiaceae bacterium]|jgi:F-type H+-transporting ATPase subunit epsilon|nr:F-type H+-transporting ATPase subunit epsilon [Acidimicrobiaceae bacterium]